MPSIDDALFGDGTTLRAYRQGLVDRFVGMGLATDKVVEHAKAIEVYVLAGANEDAKQARRITIERQLGMTGDAAKALAAAKTLEAYVTGKAA